MAAAGAGGLGFAGGFTAAGFAAGFCVWPSAGVAQMKAIKLTRVPNEIAFMSILMWHRSLWRRLV